MMFTFTFVFIILVQALSVYGCACTDCPSGQVPEYTNYHVDSFTGTLTYEYSTPDLMVVAVLNDTQYAIYQRGGALGALQELSLMEFYRCYERSFFVDEQQYRNNLNVVFICKNAVTPCTLAARVRVVRDGIVTANPNIVFYVIIGAVMLMVPGVVVIVRHFVKKMVC